MTACERINHVFNVEPMGKPRMTQRDKWKQRPAVVKYRRFKDAIRASIAATPGLPEIIASQPHGMSWCAYLPMPQSWSEKKKAAHRGQLHTQKPDRDNIDKALLDAIFPDDSGVATGLLVKRWDDGKGPRIVASFKFRKGGRA